MRIRHHLTTATCPLGLISLSLSLSVYLCAYTCATVGPHTHNIKKKEELASTFRRGDVA